jgi:hypothetical protein
MSLNPTPRLRRKTQNTVGEFENCDKAPTQVAVKWLRRLVAGLSPRSPGFAPGSIHVGFVMDKAALG